MKSYDITIIGGGVIGSFVARHVAKFNLNTIVIEKGNDVCLGSTRANSAIVHSGYSGKPGSLKAKLTRDANADFDNVCEELDVSFKRIGSLMIATDDHGAEKVQEKYKRGIKNDIPGVKIIDREEVIAIEPNINKDVKLALYAPTTGIVNPWEFGTAAMENAMDNGVELNLNTRVISIDKVDSNKDNGKNDDKNNDKNNWSNNNDINYIVKTNKGDISSKYVINCAGVYSDEIHSMVANPFFRISPRKGEYIVLDKDDKETKSVNHVIFQARDSSDSKGVIVLPTVEGNILVGPTAQDIDDKEETSVSKESLEYIKRVSSKSVENLPFGKQIRTFAGIRPRPQLLTQIDGEEVYVEDDVKDFIIGEVKSSPYFINCAGIKSPGLTCANEIGKYVADIVKDKEGEGLTYNQNYNPKRRKLYRFHEKTESEQEVLVNQNPKLGNVICRCNKITEAEVVDVIHRNCGAATVDGVKRRVGTGMGRCQGGYCMEMITEIIHRELNTPYTEIEKDAKGSYIITDIKDR